MKRGESVVGKRFGMWFVQSEYSRLEKTRKRRVADCICICGNRTTVAVHTLKTKRSTSCGCWQVLHGDVGTPEYIAWMSMMARCRRQTHRQWTRYGGRGIKVCERWNSYNQFLKDMGRKPSNKHSLDRIDNNGSYEPSNCRWATWREQQQNRSTNRLITIGNRTLCLTQWAREFNIPITTFRRRFAKELIANAFAN